ncbi:MAG TPA: TolC family protein [Bacteroidales bacterium]|nr:TolC family protein [Bacteroidales bacterium]HSA43285.1 TolC family protein [Bacteroidales bacterium]
MNRNLIFFSLFVIPRLLTGQDTLSQEEAVRLALQNNYGISIARMESRMAANNNTAGHAGFLPEVSADFSQTYNRNNTYQKFFSGQEKEGNDAKSNTLSARVELNWKLFDGFGMFIEKQKLASLQEAGEWQFKINVGNTLAAVQMQYAAIVQQEHMLEVIREAISLSKERLIISEKQLQTGAASELSMLQSKVDMQADSARWITQAGILENMKADLNLLMGRSPSESFITSGSFIIREDLQLPALEQQLASRNPEIQAALLGQKVSSLEYKASEAAYYPVISVFSGYSYGRSEYEIGILNFNRNQGINYGLTATLGLFNGFNRNLARKNAKIAAEIAGTAVSETNATLSTLLYKTYQDYRNALKRIKLETESRATAERNLFVAGENYRNGGISDLDLRLTQLKLIEAEARLIAANFDARKAEIELYRLSGEFTQ